MSRSLCVGAAIVSLSVAGPVAISDMLKPAESTAAYVVDENAPAVNQGACGDTCTAALPTVPASAQPAVHGVGLAQAAYQGHPVRLDAGGPKPGGIGRDNAGGNWHAVHRAVSAHSGSRHTVAMASPFDDNDF
ncbi:hypothetical protein B0G84_5347 [Paraburkholderia sp. BL8N3]|nr:hypothetical protein [Paraburkholderia sp. BL8N3]TCK36356.1 hypothetical protein B0G84_5347 [Paraburkholderia sp. BL8N3]